MDAESYWDENGLLHVKRGEYSENGVLFAAHCSMLKMLTGQAWYYKIPTNVVRSGWFDPNPADNNDINSHFSHDNMTGLYATFQMIYRNTKDLPVCRWNNRFWLHPRDLLFYSLMHNKVWSVAGLPFLFLAAWLSARKPRESTSGKCLWWLRLQTLKLHKWSIVRKFANKTLKFVESILVKNHKTRVYKEPIKTEVGALNVYYEVASWVDVFQIYFRDYEHPVNQLMREYYK